MFAVVTGHSRGLGAAIAEELLSRDFPVLGISRASNPALARRFPTLREMQLDLADGVATSRWLQLGQLRDCLKGRDLALLVNNAGLLQPVGPMETQDVTAVSRAVAVNVGTVLMLSAAFVQATQDARERRILQISSGAGRKAYAGWSIYCATKAALDQHARCAVMDGTPRLRICSLAPGVIDTDMQGEIRASTGELFPDRERFVRMKQDGSLRSPARVGKLATDYLLSESFGSEPVWELPR